MTREEIGKVAAIMANADHGCDSCVDDLYELAGELFPEVAWTELLGPAKDWARWKQNSVWDSETPEPPLP